MEPEEVKGACRSNGYFLPGKMQRIYTFPRLPCSMFPIIIVSVTKPTLLSYGMYVYMFIYMYMNMFMYMYMYM